MYQLFQIAERKLAIGENLMLVTVVDSSGSTPRGSGAKMLVGAEGRLAGTIGGGAVEHRCEKLAVEALREGKSLTKSFYLHADDELGMVCGGEMSVSLCYLPASDDTLNWVRAERDRLLPPGRVFIFGGGHVAQALVTALALIDFRCVVLEDRADFCQPRLFPGAQELRLVDNGDAAAYRDITEEDYVVVMTRGHRGDLVVQSHALKTPARYIGVIGSRRKTATVFAKLREMGYTDDDLARIITPIGLDIGAETPAEIAVSVAAQLIQVRSGKQ